ncbi:MAG: DNA polymerase III subunit epsilon, partial [Burkholderiaceae bacterium]
MKLQPARRLPLLLAALALVMALLAGASVALVWATLEPAERDAVAALLASRVMLVVMLWLVVFGAAAWATSRVFERFVEAPHRLAEQAQVLLAGNAARELEVQGSAANRDLAEALNALAQQRGRLRDDVALQIAQASHGIEQERSRLSALMAELTQSVVVCNLDGRILLYNSHARAQALAWSRTPATAGGAELIGLGRSIYAVFERELLAHALESIRQRARAGESQPSAQFVTSTGSGRLLRVQMAAVHSPEAAVLAHAGDATGEAAEPVEPTLSGFVLMLDDISRDFEQEALRDRLLLGMTEGSRASLGNLQAAVEML